MVQHIQHQQTCHVFHIGGNVFRSVAKSSSRYSPVEVAAKVENLLKELEVPGLRTWQKGLFQVGHLNYSVIFQRTEPSWIMLGPDEVFSASPNLKDQPSICQDKQDKSQQETRNLEGTFIGQFREPFSQFIMVMINGNFRMYLIFGHMNCGDIP